MVSKRGSVATLESPHGPSPRGANTYLEPVEVALLGVFHFQEVDSVFALFDPRELCDFREHIEALDRVLGLRIAPLELLEALLVNDPDESFAAVWGDHAPIVVHLAGLYLNEWLGPEIVHVQIAHALHLS